jgi:hypothetical protein
MPTHAAPGLYFEIARPPDDPAPLRSDIAGFIGPTRRGPVGEVVRLEEWAEFERVFGGLDPASLTSYAVRSYFENGGDVACIIRVAGVAVSTAGSIWPQSASDPPLPGHRVLTVAGRIASEAFLSDDGSPPTRPNVQPPAQPLGPATAVRELAVTASSPGDWAEGAIVRFFYRRQGPLAIPEVDVITRVAHESTESLRALPARIAGVPPSPGAEPEIDTEHLVDLVNQQSRFIRLTVDPAKIGPPSNMPGPQRLEWEVTLGGGADAPPTVADYLRAVDTMSHEPSVAMLAFPDLYKDLPFDFDPSTPLVAQPSIAVLKAALGTAEELHDRLVLVDFPTDEGAIALPLSTDRIVNLVDSMRTAFEESEWRSAAVYHPPLWVQDPLGTVAAPQRLIPASGPVAGLISRLDRERGAHHTPANAVLFDAVDRLQGFDATEHGRLNEAGVNVIRCFANRGLAVWGGRTLDPILNGRFVAHRRLTHRLVRAIHRVTQPLVFDINGPELWLTIVRGITSVLLEAFRSGALKGARPEQAFRVLNSICGRSWQNRNRSRSNRTPTTILKNTPADTISRMGL